MKVPDYMKEAGITKLNVTVNENSCSGKSDVELNDAIQRNLKSAWDALLRGDCTPYVDNTEPNWLI